MFFNFNWEKCVFASKWRVKKKKDNENCNNLVSKYKMFSWGTSLGAQIIIITYMIDGTMSTLKTEDAWSAKVGHNVVRILVVFEQVTKANWVVGKWELQAVAPPGLHQQLDGHESETQI